MQHEVQGDITAVMQNWAKVSTEPEHSLQTPSTRLRCCSKAERTHHGVLYLLCLNIQLKNYV